MFRICLGISRRVAAVVFERRTKEQTNNSFARRPLCAMRAPPRRFPILLSPEYVENEIFNRNDNRRYLYPCLERVKFERRTRSAATP